MAAADGAFRGYVKPFFESLEVFRLKEEEEDNPFRLAWEAIVEGVGKLLENAKKDQVATRIPLEDTLDEPDVGLWATVTELLRNAFIQALVQGLEDSISLGDAEKEALGVSSTSE